MRDREREERERETDRARETEREIENVGPGPHAKWARDVTSLNLYVGPGCPYARDPGDRTPRTPGDQQVYTSMLGQGARMPRTPRGQQIYTHLCGARGPVSQWAP